MKVKCVSAWFDGVRFAVEEEVEYTVLGIEVSTRHKFAQGQPLFWVAREWSPAQVPCACFVLISAVIPAAWQVRNTSDATAIVGYSWLWDEKFQVELEDDQREALLGYQDLVRAAGIAVRSEKAR